MSTRRRKSWWQYLGALAAPLLLLTFVFTLWEPLTSWIEGERRYDEEILSEWLREARVYRTLPELLTEYVASAIKYRKAVEQNSQNPKAGDHSSNKSLRNPDDSEYRSRFLDKEEEIQTHLRTMGEAVTKVYRGQLPLFPVIYRVEIAFEKDLQLADIVWDSQLPRHDDKQSHQQQKQFQEFVDVITLTDNETNTEHKAKFTVQYHFRVFATRQYKERQRAANLLQLSGFATIFITVFLLWWYLSQSRERQRQRQHMLAEKQLNEAERLRLQEELRRQEAERRHEEAERTNLELKSQLWANIGILAGSYAHNIKNLLVRPNDLLARCLESDGLSSGQGHMLQEIRHTLGTVTERLQHILHTVRRDPTETERARIDLNDLVGDMIDTWKELAEEKWRAVLISDLEPAPLWIEGDHSHLQQAVENLIFNARDATFEMRNHLRERARQPKAERDRDKCGDTGQQQRRALIAAAGWKGEIILRTRRQADHAVLEVADNGIGMSEEVRRRCTETHFSTKRHSALFAGFSSGMGLGLSFIQVILEHHQAALEVESEEFKGTTFRIRFPAMKAENA